MRKKVGILLIIFGIIGIISILTITNKEEITNKITSISAQIKNLFAQQQVEFEKKETEEGELPIKISYSDLSIDEKITGITKIGDKQEKQEISGDGKLAKTEVSRKKDETTQIKIEYEIKIENKGNEAGTIENIIASLPDGMKVSQESSSMWKSSGSNTLEYNEKEELEEDKSKTIKLAIEGVASETMGEQKTETVLISSEDSDQRIVEEESNQKIDKSNAKQKMMKTNNYSSSTAIISINTWLKDYSNYLIILLVILIIIGIIIYKTESKREQKEESL